MAKVPPIPTLAPELVASRECLTVVPPKVMEPRKSVAETDTAATGAGSSSVPFFTVTLSSTASVLPPRKVRATLPSIPMEAPALALEPADGAAPSSSLLLVPSGSAALLASPMAPVALGAALSFLDSTLSCSKSFVFFLASLEPSLPFLDHLSHFSESFLSFSSSSSESAVTTLALASF